MDKETEQLIDDGLKDMEEEREAQRLEDAAKLSIKITTFLMEIMNEVPEGTYANITPEEGSALLESIEKRYPVLNIEYDPGFLFWGYLFREGYETFTVDFLDKIIKLEPAKVKLFFVGLYDLYIGAMQEAVEHEVSLLNHIISSYENGKIEDAINEIKETLNSINEAEEEKVEE